MCHQSSCLQTVCSCWKCVSSVWDWQVINHHHLFMYLLKITLRFPSAFHSSLLFCVDFLFRLGRCGEYTWKIRVWQFVPWPWCNNILIYSTVRIYYICSLLEYPLCEECLKIIFITFVHILICIQLILCVIQFYVYVSTLYSYKIFYIVHVIVDIWRKSTWRETAVLSAAQGLWHSIRKVIFPSQSFSTCKCEIMMLIHQLHTSAMRVN